MKNQVIKALDTEHGKKILEYWSKQGVHTGGWVGNATEKSGSQFCYYGVINDIFNNWHENLVIGKDVEIITLPEENAVQEKWCVKVTNKEEKTIVSRWFDQNWNNTELKPNFYEEAFTGIGMYYCYGIERGDVWSTYARGQELTFQEFEKYILKQTKQETMNEVTRGDLVKALKKFTCDKWKDQIKDILSPIKYESDTYVVTIPQSAIDLLRREGTPEQKTYVKSLGVKLEEDILLQIKTLPAYKIFEKEVSSDSRLTIENNYIKILLPHANTEWALAAFDLAKEIVRGFGYTIIRPKDSYDFITLRK